MINAGLGLSAPTHVAVLEDSGADTERWIAIDRAGAVLLLVRPADAVDWASARAHGQQVLERIKSGLDETLSWTRITPEEAEEAQARGEVYELCVAVCLAERCVKDWNVRFKDDVEISERSRANLMRLLRISSMLQGFYAQMLALETSVGVEEKNGFVAEPGTGSATD